MDWLSGKKRELSAFLLGLMAFFLNNHYMILADKANDVYFFPALIIPILVALAWGWRCGLICCVLGLVAFSPFWAVPLNGWGNLSTALAYAVWVFLHGWCAQMRRSGRLAFYSLYIAQLAFVLAFLLSNGILTQFLVRFNPIYAGAVSLKFVSMSTIMVNARAFILYTTLLTFVANSLLSLKPVARAFGLPEEARSSEFFIITALATVLAVMADEYFYMYAPTYYNVYIHLSQILRIMATACVIYFLGDIFRAILEFQRLEQESSDRQTNLYSNISDIYLELAEGGRIMEMSNAAPLIFNCRREALRHRNLFDFFVYRHQALRVLNGIRNGEDLKNVEVQIKREGEAEQAGVLLIRSAVKQKNGRVTFFARDITDYKELKHAQLEQQAVINTVFEWCDDLIWTVKDQDNRLAVFNRACGGYFEERFNLVLQSGMTPDEMFGDESGFWQDCYKSIVRYERWRETYTDTNNGRVYEIQGYLMMHDDRTRTLSVFLQDVTTMVEKTKNMELMNQELELSVKKRIKDMEEAHKELDRYSYIVSHEIKTPIRAIQAYNQIINEESLSILNNEAQMAVVGIDRMCNSTLVCIEGLLAHTKVKARELQLGYVDMNRLVEEVFAEFGVVHQGRQMELIRENMPYTTADAFLIKQVVY
ncbi:MAG: hypothetical protein LBT32_05590, partial [Peptococcaceae bacterium]|nr:hypothetical protein [Peptococcaceae bacterium]